MLKAVRFDEDKHKNLLDWIANYRDAKNKTNESEAIRYLMKIGLDKINENGIITTLINEQDTIGIPEPIISESHEQQEPLDKESLKRELMAEMMAEVNNKMLGKLTAAIDKLGNINIQPTIVHVPTPTQNPIHASISSVTEHEIPISKPIKKRVNAAPIEGNALLANILGNADR